MTQTIRSPDASWQPTPASGSPGIRKSLAPAAKTGRVPGKVIHASFDAQPEPFLPGHVEIDDLVAHHERDAKRHALLVDARKKLAKDFYPEQQGLAALRLRKGLSQAALAMAIGTCQSHIARLEKGHDDPRLSTIQRLANALDTGLDEIALAIYR